MLHVKGEKRAGRVMVSGGKRKVLHCVDGLFSDPKHSKMLGSVSTMAKQRLRHSGEQRHSRDATLTRNTSPSKTRKWKSVNCRQMAARRAQPAPPDRPADHPDSPRLARARERHSVECKRPRARRSSRPPDGERKLGVRASIQKQRLAERNVSDSSNAAVPKVSAPTGFLSQRSTRRLSPVET